MASETAFRAFPAILLAERQNVAAMTAPICCHIRVRKEPVRNSVVDLLLLRVRLSITLTDALGDDAGIAFGVAGVFAVFALHASRVLQEVTAQSTSHDVVELLLYELVAVHLMHLLLALTNSAFSSKTKVHLPTVLVGLDKAHLELKLTTRLKIEQIGRAHV